MAPKPPNVRHAPAKPWRASVPRVLAEPLPEPAPAITFATVTGTTVEAAG